LNGFRDALGVVADGDGAIQVHSQAAQGTGEKAGVGIYNFTEQDFGADGNDLSRGHGFLWMSLLQKGIFPRRVPSTSLRVNFGREEKN
jgi:hypothetical protein